LWERMTRRESLDVRLLQEVIRIERVNGTKHAAKLTTIDRKASDKAGKPVLLTWHADWLVIACPFLPLAKVFAHLYPSEQEMMQSQVHYGLATALYQSKPFPL